MSIVTVTDLHTVADPERHLASQAALARAHAGTNVTRLIVRTPDRDTHGIRIFRADDIATMLQKHGRIREIAITDNGTIVAAADLVKRRGEVAVWTGQAIGPWHPNDILQRGLGGSETAAVRLAEQLAAIGHIVTLYGQFDQTGMAGDVMLRDFREFDPTAPLDALVVFRDARQLDHRPNARFVALWLEDLAPAEGLTAGRAANIDRVCTVSHWHKEQVQREYPWIDPSLVTACRNGIVERWFSEPPELVEARREVQAMWDALDEEGAEWGDRLSESESILARLEAQFPVPEREKRVIYSSSPDRGGDIVLECWAAIRERVPDAELILTYPRWFELCAEQFQASNSHRERIRELVQQDGVRRLDTGMGQKQLAHLLRASLVWCNPGYYTPGAQKFDETSCITSLEAQAAGCVVVASNWGAVTESVRYGTLIDGNPGERDGQWRRDFVDAIVAGLTDPVVQAAAQTCGPEMMAGMDWRGAAEQLAAMFPAERVNANYGALATA